MKVQDILKACNEYGVTLTALEGGRIDYRGNITPELTRVIKLRKPEIWKALPPPKVPDKHAGMIGFLRQMIDIPDIVIWRGQRYDVADVARSLLGVPTNDEWWERSGMLWSAWMAEDSEWYADAAAYGDCQLF